MLSKKDVMVEFMPANKVYLVNRSKADVNLKEGSAIAGWGRVVMRTAAEDEEKKLDQGETIPRTLQCQWQGQASCIWKGAIWPAVKLVHHLRNPKDQSMENLNVKGYLTITPGTTALQKNDAPRMLFEYTQGTFPTDEKQKAKLKASSCASLVPQEASNFN